MKRKYMIPVMASLLAMGACDYNEDNFEGFEDLSRPTNVQRVNYTLTDADYEAMDANVKANKYFTSTDEADNNIPRWLADKYFTADQGFSANITYRMKTVYPYYQNIAYGLLTEEDYAVIYGEGYNNATFLNASNVSRMYRILREKYTDSQIGDLVMVDYQYSENGQPSRGETIAYWDFEDLEIGDNNNIESLDGGWYISASGNKWQAREYSNNKYLQYTANNAEGAAEGWLVTPGIAVPATGQNLAWDVCVGYWNADCLKVLISTNFAGDVDTATWTDVTDQFNIPQEPASGYGTFASAGAMSLDSYAGQTIYVAYHYEGNGSSDNRRTTTYQIDNIMVANEIAQPVESETRYALYEYRSNGWYEFNNSTKAIVFPYYEYEQMGDAGEYLSFSSSTKAEDYIPNFLQKVGPEYPVNGDTCTVIYRYYAGSGKYEAHADQYIYNDTANVWKYSDNIYQETRPYAFNGSEWVYSPSVTIELPYGKNIPESAEFYQAITDWVIANHPEYVTSYKNNDYYYGGSAYQNNFDFRVSAWKQQGTYDNLSDADIEALMWERLPEAFPHALEALYPDADVAENGVPVIYTINFYIYNGSATLPWTIQYEVVGKGQFEYIEDSLQEVK